MELYDVFEEIYFLNPCFWGEVVIFHEFKAGIELDQTFP